jgi:outer membrane scaffolding protein for murein synthesis (MipA/OmpV family)
MPHMSSISLGHFRLVGILVGLLWAAAASAQTPAPFAYWQNSSGVVLAPLGGPIPDWRVALGAGVASLPLYEGSDRYYVTPVPAFDIRYRDIAFLSSGDGVGVNLLRGETYRAGVAVAYDLGRSPHLNNSLNGLGFVEAAPEAKLFAEAAFLPFVVTADLRRAIGGNQGVIGDLGAYMPVIGTEELVVFLGPSVSLANQRYMQSYFGVTDVQSAESRQHFPIYSPDGGLKNVAFGVTTIYHFTDHWFVDGDLAWERLLDTAANSPIVEIRTQLSLSLIVGYEF